MYQWASRWSVVVFLLVAAMAEPQEKPVKPFADDLEGETNACFCVSRDGKKLALNFWSIWAIPSGKKLVAGHTRGAHSMAFSPDGKLLAVGGNYSELFVYDASTGKVFWDLTLIGHANSVLNHVEFTPDGRFLLSTSDNGIMRVWDLRAKKARALFCFTSKDEVCNGWKEYLSAWRALAGKDRPPDDVKTFVIFKQPIEMISQFAISPDSKSVAMALGTAEVWILEIETGKLLNKFHTDQESNYSVCFSKDGKFLVVGGGDDKPDRKKCTIEVWDVVAGKRVAVCPGHRLTVWRLAVSPDSKTIISGGAFDGLRVWDLATGKQRFALHQEGKRRIWNVAFLPDGKTFLTLTDLPNDPVRFWDVATGRPVSPSKGQTSQ